MKYKFTHDAEYLKTHIADLSEDEMLAVLCTILGGHNAEFYGYQTERIDNAIKLLEEKVQGIIPFNDKREQVFYDSDTRLIEFKERDFDIVHHCEATSEVIDYRIDDLVEILKKGWEAKILRDTSLNCNIKDIVRIQYSSVARNGLVSYGLIYSDDRLLKFGRVARTIADIRGRSLVWSADLNRAVKLYNN